MSISSQQFGFSFVFYILFFSIITFNIESSAFEHSTAPQYRIQFAKTIRESCTKCSDAHQRQDLRHRESISIAELQGYFGSSKTLTSIGPIWMLKNSLTTLVRRTGEKKSNPTIMLQLLTKTVAGMTPWYRRLHYIWFSWFNAFKGGHLQLRLFHALAVLPSH